MNKGNKILVVIIIIFICVALFLLFKKMPNNSTLITQVQTEQSSDESQPVTVTCVDTYKNTEESKVAFEESNALITRIEKRCDGVYYVTVDYLSPGNDTPDDDIGFFDNTNMKLRTFKVASNFQVEVLHSDYNERINSYTYLPAMQKYPHGETFGRDGVYWRHGAFSNVYKLKVQNGVIVVMDEVYLP